MVRSPINLPLYGALLRDGPRVRDSAPHTGNGRVPRAVQLASLELDFENLTANAICERTDDETLLTTIAVVVDRDDVTRCDLSGWRDGLELLNSLVGGHGYLAGRREQKWRKYRKKRNSRMGKWKETKEPIYIILIRCPPSTKGEATHEAEAFIVEKKIIIIIIKRKSKNALFTWLLYVLATKVRQGRRDGLPGHVLVLGAGHRAA